MLMRNTFGLAVLLALGTAVACGSDSDDGGSGGKGGTGNGGSAGGGAGGTAGTNSDGAAGTGNSAGVAGTGGFNPDGGISACQGHVYECGDTIDNDGDGLKDEQDPDCLGPCDNTEGSYYGGIPGQNKAPCKADCYFDQDTGPGNDDCYWNHECDPLSVAPAYPPEGDSCKYNAAAKTPGTSKSCAELDKAQSKACGDYCGPLTPNGCDCFGCCELPAGGGKFVYLGSEVNGIGSCDIASLGDPAKCKPCTPVAACLNGCGKCEVCIGKPTVPAECYPPDGGYDAGYDAGYDGGVDLQCPVGKQPCGLPGQASCASGYYCITGCCQPVPS